MSKIIEYHKGKIKNQQWEDLPKDQLVHDSVSPTPYVPVIKLSWLLIEALVVPEFIVKSEHTYNNE